MLNLAYRAERNKNMIELIEKQIEIWLTSTILKKIKNTYKKLSIVKLLKSPACKYVRLLNSRSLRKDQEHKYSSTYIKHMHSVVFTSWVYHNALSISGSTHGGK